MFANVIFLTVGLLLNPNVQSSNKDLRNAFEQPYKSRTSNARTVREMFQNVFGRNYQLAPGGATFPDPIRFPNFFAAIDLNQFREDLKRASVARDRRRGVINNPPSTTKKPVKPSRPPETDIHKLLSDLSEDFERQPSRSPAPNKARKHQTSKKKQQTASQHQSPSKPNSEKQSKVAKTSSNEASVWLEKLDRQSSEGQYFVEFSFNYETELEAAIDYLDYMK